MGIVLKAHDSELNRPVAIKVLAPHLAHSGAARQRFAQYEREYMAGLYDPWTDAVNRDCVLVSEAIEAFVKSRDGCSEKTIAN